MRSTYGSTQFFDVAYSMAGAGNFLADFLVNVLRRDEERGEYLHFKVAENLQIQNLLENMIYSIVTGKGRGQPDQPDHHGTDFSVSFGFSPVCGNADFKSL